MSKQCPNCGNFLLDNERFCTRCGANLNGDDPNAGAANPQPTQQNTANTYVPPQPQYTYQQPVQQPAMTTGQWVGTIIVTTWFGIISLILTLVWAFDSTTNPSKKNYCRAVLIIDLIGIGICVLLCIIFAVAGFGIFSNIASSGYYY